MDAPNLILRCLIDCMGNLDCMVLRPQLSIWRRLSLATGFFLTPDPLILTQLAIKTCFFQERLRHVFFFFPSFFIFFLSSPLSSSTFSLFVFSPSPPFSSSFRFFFFFSLASSLFSFLSCLLCVPPAFCFVSSAFFSLSLFLLLFSLLSLVLFPPFLFFLSSSLLSFLLVLPSFSIFSYAHLPLPSAPFFSPFFLSFLSFAPFIHFISLQFLYFLFLVYVAFFPVCFFSFLSCCTFSLLLLCFSLGFFFSSLVFSCLSQLACFYFIFFLSCLISSLLPSLVSPFPCFSSLLAPLSPLLSTILVFLFWATSLFVSLLFPLPSSLFPLPSSLFPLPSSLFPFHILILYLPSDLLSSVISLSPLVFSPPFLLFTYLPPFLFFFSSFSSGLLSLLVFSFGPSSFHISSSLLSMSSIYMWRFQNSTPSLNMKRKHCLRIKTNHKNSFIEECFRFVSSYRFFSPQHTREILGNLHINQNARGYYTLPYRNTQIAIQFFAYSEPRWWCVKGWNAAPLQNGLVRLVVKGVMKGVLVQGIRTG